MQSSVELLLASDAKQDQYQCRLPEEARLPEALLENESRWNGDIHKIQKWLDTQPRLNARSDAVNVLRFLRGCKFDEERTRWKLTNFYVMRAKVPEWFTNRDPLLPELQVMLDLGVLLPMRQHSAEGQLTILIRAVAHDPRVQTLDDLFKASHIILDVLLEDDESVPAYGVIAVCDLQGVTFGHFRQLTPATIRKAVHSWQNCYPVRIKGIVFINAPYHVGMVLNIFKRFMSEKMRNRVQVHYKGSDYLRGIPSAELLPLEYGGEGGRLRDLIGEWKRRAINRRDWLLEGEKYKADTS